VSSPRLFGITGWKNAGKTTLTECLVAEFVRRGWRVSTVKHAHHDIDIDRPGTDSYRHRAAGAGEVALVGGRRYAIMRETPEPAITEVLARLAPADLVLIEGYKREPHPKIEVRASPEAEPLGARVTLPSWRSPPIVRPVEGDLPWFRRDDIAAIADFIAARIG